MLDSTTLELDHDDRGRLVAWDESGQEIVSVELTRLFPLSAPGDWLSVCTADGREVVCWPSLADLPERLRLPVLVELSSRELTPHIEAIVAATPGPAPGVWHVRTDRGETRLTIKSEDDLRRLPNRGIAITDASGWRWLIPDANRLDRESRRTLERWL